MDKLTNGAAEAFQFMERNFNKLPKGVQKVMKAPFQSFVDQAQTLYKGTQNEDIKTATKGVQFNPVQLTGTSPPRQSHEYGNSHYKQALEDGNTPLGEDYEDVEVGEEVYEAGHSAASFIGKHLHLKIDTEKDHPAKTVAKAGAIGLMLVPVVAIAGTAETLARGARAILGDDAMLLNRKLVAKRQDKPTEKTEQTLSNPDKFVLQKALRLPVYLMPTDQEMKDAKGFKANGKLVAKFAGVGITGAAIVLGAGLVRTGGKALKGAGTLKTAAEQKYEKRNTPPDFKDIQLTLKDAQKIVADSSQPLNQKALESALESVNKYDKAILEDLSERDQGDDVHLEYTRLFAQHRLERAKKKGAVETPDTSEIPFAEVSVSTKEAVEILKKNGITMDEPEIAGIAMTVNQDSEQDTRATAQAPMNPSNAPAMALKILSQARLDKFDQTQQSAQPAEASATKTASPTPSSLQDIQLTEEEAEQLLDEKGTGVGKKTLKKACKAVNAYDEKRLMDSEERAIPSSRDIDFKCATILAKARLERAKAAGVIVPFKEIQVSTDRAKEILAKKSLFLEDKQVEAVTRRINSYSLQNTEQFADESRPQIQGIDLSFAHHLIAKERLTMAKERTRKA